jgi:hypothetical protein
MKPLIERCAAHPAPLSSRGAAARDSLPCLGVRVGRRCWAHDPAGRPKFGDIVAELRGMLGTSIGGRE